MKYQWWLIIAVILIGLPRLYRQTFERRYGLADIYYYADILKAYKVQEPAWTNCLPIYIEMNWKVQGNFLDSAFEWPTAVDWTKKPYSDLKTIAFFDIHNNFGHPLYKEMEPRPGWTTFDIRLKRGSYQWLRLLKRR